MKLCRKVGGKETPIIKRVYAATGAAQNPKMDDTGLSNEEICRGYPNLGPQVPSTTNFGGHLRYSGPPKPKLCSAALGNIE